MPLRPFIEAAPIHVDELQALAEAKQILASAKMRVDYELVLTSGKRLHSAGTASRRGHPQRRHQRFRVEHAVDCKQT